MNYNFKNTDNKEVIHGHFFLENPWRMEHKKNILILVGIKKEAKNDK
tara:strand:+ start:1390 stop:1530 length:141 start_codon:yes stop_codon:yes gene_type:complete